MKFFKFFFIFLFIFFAPIIFLSPVSSTENCIPEQTRCVGQRICKSKCQACDKEGKEWHCTEQSYWCNWCLTPMPEPTINPNCVCNNNSCNDYCTFNRFAPIPPIEYAEPIKCKLPSNIFDVSPVDSDKNAWCKASLRTKGDADGNGQIDIVDYGYYIAAVSGGKIRAGVNPDFNGDGEVGTKDRAIIMKSLTD